MEFETTLVDGILQVQLNKYQQRIWEGKDDKHISCYILEELSTHVPLECKEVRIGDTVLPVCGILEDIPDIMAKALEIAATAFVLEMGWMYLTSSPEDQQAYLDFFKSNGPERARKFQLRQTDGTPTPGDLEKWSNSSG